MSWESKKHELGEGPDMSGARAARQSYRLCEQAALFVQAVLFTIPPPGSRRGVGRAIIPQQVATVFSLLGVLGITFVLFVGVVMTAGLILGK
jgi:hypothetical protein